MALREWRSIVWRAQGGLSLADVAARMGLTTRHTSPLLRGEALPESADARRERVDKLISVLEIGATDALIMRVLAGVSDG